MPAYSALTEQEGTAELWDLVIITGGDGLDEKSLLMIGVASLGTKVNPFD